MGFRKLFCPVALFLICFAATELLSACSKGNENEEMLKKNIVGKWKMYSMEGVLCLTDEKSVNEFFADGGYTYTTFKDNQWFCREKGSYSISGEKLTISYAQNYSSQCQLSFKDGRAVVKQTKFDIPGAAEVGIGEMEKVTADYSQAIFGLWEGVKLTGPETFGAENHRWEYLDDGTYCYYSKNESGAWEADSSNEENLFFVDGDLLCFRWVRDGVQYREWWEIDECDGERMVWKALREGNDGVRFETTLEMKKIR